LVAGVAAGHKSVAGRNQQGYVRATEPDAVTENDLVGECDRVEVVA
jgi:hypothetical protein